VQVSTRLPSALDLFHRLQHLVDVAVDRDVLEDLSYYAGAIDDVRGAHGGACVAQDPELRRQLLVLIGENREVSRALDRVLLLSFNLVNADTDNFCVERVELAAPSSKLCCFARSARGPGPRIEKDDHFVVAAVIAQIDGLAVLILGRKAGKRLARLHRHIAPLLAILFFLML
jgi:hypothetical protein